MRSIALLVFLLSTPAASVPALASDFDLEPLQQKLSIELQERIEQSVLPALAARMERQPRRGPALPARIGAGPDPARTTAAVPLERDADALPARMTCRASTAYALECVVVSQRYGRERLAKVN
jgi:hypothetical protein